MEVVGTNMGHIADSLFNGRKHDKKPKKRERHHAREKKERNKHKADMDDDFSNPWKDGDDDEDDFLAIFWLVYCFVWISILCCCGAGFCGAIYYLKTSCDKKSEQDRQIHAAQQRASQRISTGVFPQYVQQP